MREERLAGLQHGAIEIEVDAIRNTGHSVSQKASSRDIPLRFKLRRKSFKAST